MRGAQARSIISASESMPAIRYDPAQEPSSEGKAEIRRLFYEEAKQWPSRVFEREGWAGHEGCTAARAQDMLPKDLQARRDFHCADCGYGAVASVAPACCPMCGATRWEEQEQREG